MPSALSQNITVRELLSKGGRTLPLDSRWGSSTSQLSRTAVEQEWHNSGVDPGIVALNVTEVRGQEAIELMLASQISRLQKVTSYVTAPAIRLLERYEHLEKGGWWASGVDPLNSYERMEWGQLKPNSPRFNEKEQPIKYEGPPGEPTRAIFLDVPAHIADRIYAQAGANPSNKDRANGFWHCVEQYKLPVVIAEGAKKAGAVLTAGFPAIALPGIWNGRRSERDQWGRISSETLIPDLQPFNDGRRIIFSFDQDEKAKTRHAVAGAVRATSRLFEAGGCECVVARWPPSSGKGIDDVAVAQGHETVRSLLMQATPYNDQQALSSLHQFSPQNHQMIAEVDLWHCHAQAIGQPERYLERIKEVRNEAQQGFPPSDRAVAAMERDKSTWFNQVEAIAKDAHTILMERGQPMDKGFGYIGKNRALYEADDKLYILAIGRGAVLEPSDHQFLPPELSQWRGGMILKIEGDNIDLACTRVTNHDAQKFAALVQSLEQERTDPNPDSFELTEPAKAVVSLVWAVHDQQGLDVLADSSQFKFQVQEDLLLAKPPESDQIMAIDRAGDIRYSSFQPDNLQRFIEGCEAAYRALPPPEHPVVFSHDMER